MRWFALSLLLLASVGASPPSAQPAAVSVTSESGIQVTVDPNGHFSIQTATPAFAFAGDVGQPVTNLRQSDGRDGIGIYRVASFDTNGRTYGIRAYNSAPVVLFTTEYRATTSSPDTFPTLRTYPSLPYRLSYRTLPFAPYQFNSLDNAADSPWFFFDQSGNAFVLSPATNFPVARSTMAADGALSNSIAPVGVVPAQASHASMLVVGTGINQLFATWGQALQRGYQKTRPANDADLTLRKLGYWTDNGATYYYNFDHSLGYEGTLLAVTREFAQRGINLGYAQVDSWWYPKGADARWDDGLGGIFRYRAAADLFPSDLAGFQQQVGLPLVTHARWIDKASPLRSEFATSGNVITDAAYWDDTMRYLHGSGVVTYEQDWLGDQAQPVYDLAAPEQFLLNMSNSAAKNQMTIQYCMPLPRHELQTLLYPNVTTMRVSYDRFDSSHWDEFLYDSTVASAIGVWPFTDVFMSRERSNLVIATLSAGIVGVGDPIGGVDVDNLRRVIRADGTIVKPDMPIVPTDATFLAEATTGPRSPMIASTYSDHDGLRAAYVFAYARGAPQQDASFAPAELGVTGPAYVYDVFADQGTPVPAGGRFSASISQDGALYVVAPVGPSGVAFLGDQGLFASLGKKRISQLRDDGGSLQATVEFAAGESAVTLHGYAPSAPTVTSADGSVEPVVFDPGSSHFSVVVHPAATPGRASIEARLDAAKRGAEA